MQKHWEKIMWKAYEINLKLLSPLHIGWRKTSNFNQTRFYIPAKTMWGALTARITRDNKDMNQQYIQVGKDLNDYYRFSYFYPYFKSNNNEVIKFPWEDPYFEYNFVNSYQSAALDVKSAVDGMLHEIEYLSPFTREGNQVFLKGYIFEDDNNNSKLNLNLDKIMDALPKIQLGAERGYGWGRVELVNNYKKMITEDIFGYKFDNSHQDPVIKYLMNSHHENKYLLAHTLVEENNLHIEGKIEPFIGRIYSEKADDKFSQAFVCWIPGSKINNNSEVCFKICADGLWSIM